MIYKKGLKLFFFLIICLTFNNCSDEEICQHTYQVSDGFGNNNDVTIDYPCELGPPVTEPVNGIVE